MFLFIFLTSKSNVIIIRKRFSEFYFQCFKYLHKKKNVNIYLHDPEDINCKYVKIIITMDERNYILCNSQTYNALKKKMERRICKNEKRGVKTVLVIYFWVMECIKMNR